MSDRRKRLGWPVAIAAAVAAGVAATVWVVVVADPAGRTGSGLSKEFAYDTTALRRVDPALILFRPADEIATGFAEARALAVGADGRVYAAGDRAVRIFTAAGDRAGEIALDAPPRALAVDEAAALYIAMADRIEVYTSYGKRTASWPSRGERAVLTSVAVSPTEVFVADAGKREVLRYDKMGQLLGILGHRDADRGVLGIIVRGPYLDVATAPDGLVRVANSGRMRVEAYYADGRLEFAWGRASMDKIEGFCGCCNPTDIAVFADGRVATAEKGIPRVKLYDAHGELLAVVAPPELFDEQVVGLDLAIDPAGRILVLDPATRAIRIFVAKEEQ